MKNIFSSKLYLQGLRKVRTLGVAMAIVMIALNAWIPLTHINKTQQIINGTISVKTVEAGQFAPFGLLFLIFVPLLVYNMFSYLNERKASDFFHALPQKRICIYISFMSAILTWITSVLLLSTMINSVLWSAAKYYTATADVIVLTTLGFFILALVMAGFMALAMMLTGTAVANCLVFFLFSLFIRAFGMFFLYGLDYITSMFNPMHSWLRIFEWEFFLPLGIFVEVADSGSTNAVFSNAGMLIYWFVVAILLWVAAGIAYCLRKSESATKSAPNKIMQNIYRIGVTFPFMMLGAFLYITDDGLYLFLLCMLVAFLVWVIFELLTTKKVKNVLRSLPLFLIPVLMTVGFFASLYGTRDFIKNNTPDRDQIIGAKIDVSATGKQNFINTVLAVTETNSTETLNLVYQAIQDTKICENMTYQERRDQGYIYRDTVIVRLRSGRKIAYNLVTKIDLYTAFCEAVNVREKIILGLFSDENLYGIYGMDLEQPYYEEIWNALKKDFQALSDEQKDQYLSDIAYYTSGFAIYIENTYQGMKFTQVYNIDPVYTPNAMNWLMQYYEKNEADTLNTLLSLKKAPDLYSMAINSYVSEEKIQNITYDSRIVQEFLNTLSIDDHLTDYANAKYFYRVSFKMTPDDKTSKSFVLTFSEEDIRIYQEIVARTSN